MRLLLWGRTLLSYLLLAIIVAIAIIPVTIFVFIPERWRYDNKLFYWFSHFFYVATVKATFLPIEVVGRDNLPKEPAIIAVNHQSALDIPLVGHLLGAFPHMWFAKIELIGTFLLGFIVRRVAVLVDVRSPAKARRALVEGLKRVQDRKQHAIIFPEGGRYLDGTVHKFYGGFVVMAKETKRPVVPIRIYNVQKVFPPGSFFVYRYPIKIVIGKPMHMQEGEDNDAFKERVYQWFTDLPDEG